MTTLPPIPEVSYEIAQRAIKWNELAFAGFDAVTAAYPHIVIATLRWLADQQPTVEDARATFGAADTDWDNYEGGEAAMRVMAKRIADEIEAGL